MIVQEITLNEAIKEWLDWDEGSMYFLKYELVQDGTFSESLALRLFEDRISDFDVVPYTRDQFSEELLSFGFRKIEGNRFAQGDHIFPKSEDFSDPEPYESSIVIVSSWHPAPCSRGAGQTSLLGLLG